MFDLRGMVALAIVGFIVCMAAVIAAIVGAAWVVFKLAGV